MTSISKEPAPSVGAVPRIRIQFGRSPSIKFQEAVQRASRLPGYTCVGEGRTEAHTVDVPISIDDLSAWRKARDLSKLVSSWKGSEVELIDCGESRQVDTLHVILSELHDCYRGWTKSKLKGDYCSGKDAPDDRKENIGCRLLPKFATLEDG